MNTLAVFAGLLAITFIGSRAIFRQRPGHSPITYALQSGTIFLLFGILISPNGLDIIHIEVLKQLRPLIHFGLGWVGFLYGFQLEWRYLRKISRNWYFTAGIVFIFPTGCLLVAAWAGFRYLLGLEGFVTAWVLILAAIMAFLLAESCTAFVFWANRRYRLTGRQYRMINFAAATDNFFPIMGAALLGMFFPNQTNGLHALAIISLEILIGVLGGSVLHYLARRVKDPLEVSTILFGIVFLLSGIAYIFRFSPLFVTMVAGITFTNRTRRHAWFQKRLNPVEKPLYLMFMIVLPLYGFGAGWIPLLIAAILVVVKFTSKLGAMVITKPLLHASREFPAQAAFLLLPMSAIGPAILLEIRERFQVEWMSWVAAIFIFAMLISEWIAVTGMYLFNRRSSR